MTRTIRRGALLLLAMTIAATLHLGTASMASAATNCKSYDQFPLYAGVSFAARVCSAPASDFPTYSGWGHVVEKSTTLRHPCGFSLLPADFDDTRTAVACPAVIVPSPIQAWRWSGAAWSSVSSDALAPGERAYFAPYAAGWHWAWTKQTGWVAIESTHAAYRWIPGSIHKSV